MSDLNLKELPLGVQCNQLVDDRHDPGLDEADLRKLNLVFGGKSFDLGVPLAFLTVNYETEDPVLDQRVDLGCYPSLLSF